ncbi:MAG: (Fe-S)-binding protein [Nanoarchaeota archaeon]|nr:(Fe-S)-binding protein [Nanoarchaeota archaeon]
MGLFGLFGKRGKTLYFAGCTSRRFLRDSDDEYKQILNKLEIGYIELDKEICCGLGLIDAGFEKDARKLARKNYDLFKELNVNKIITSCPGCFKMFSEYKDFVLDWGIEVEHVIVSIAENLDADDIIYSNSSNVTYHDPCYLSRFGNVVDAPRKILRMIGYNVVEMWHNKEDTLCCGAGGGMIFNNKILANRIAKKRIQEAEDVSVNKIVTSCPMCVHHLSENSSEIVIESMSNVISSALGIKLEVSKDEGED